MHRVALILVAVTLAAPMAPGQTKALSQGPHRMEIVLEKQEGAAARTVDPGLVFQQGDRIRFRVRTNFDGYLYVMNQSTSGRYTLLFPGEDTGKQNRIEAGRDYLVPATEGWFRITGPPGHEIVYWLASPVELQSDANGAKPAYVPLPPPPKPGKVPPSLTPRCDDTILRARGDCVDTSAGAKPVQEKDRLPENLARGGAGPTPRDLIFMRQQKATVVASPAPLTGPVVFEFRLAHK